MNWSLTRLLLAWFFVFPRISLAWPQDPGSLEEKYQSAQDLLASGKYAEAERAFEALARVDPRIAEVHANLGLIYFEERKFEEAVPALRQALKLKPALAKSGNLLAMSVYHRYLERGPEFVDAYLDFLAAGGSTRPDELVKRLGMDITNPDFWDAGLKILDGMVTEVERLSETR